MTAPGEIDLHTFADGRLVKVAGGTSLYIPVQIYPGTKLATLIGEKNAKALVAAHGGEIIEVPLGRKRSRHPERQSIVRTLLTRQLSDQEVSRTFHVHRRTVARLRYRIRELFA